MEQDLSELLFNALNEQGFIFQEACADCLKKESTGWTVKASEYPVSLKGEDTRVDIVLSGSGAKGEELWAIIECKRADPEYVYWLFGLPGLPLDRASCTALGFESRHFRKGEPLNIRKLVEPFQFQLSTYRIIWWAEVKRRPDKRASTPQNIESAFAQVLRGTAGFAEDYLKQLHKDPRPFKAYFIPIVITTARLYVAHYELENVDLETGTIERERVFFAPKGQPPEELEWVLADYGAGEKVAPESIPEGYLGFDPSRLQEFKTRSIFVVNAKSIPNFFSKLRLY